MTPSSNKPVHHYQRFIPREEVQAFSAWEFPSMDGNRPKPAPAPEPIPEPEPEPVPPPPPAGPTEEEIEVMRQAAYAEGIEQGRLIGEQETRAALEAPLQQQLQEQTQRLADLLTQTQAGLLQLQETLAAQVLDLACDLARQVVRRELQQSIEPIQAVVQEALALGVTEGRPATLKLHPADLELLGPDLADSLAAQHIKLQADPNLTPGGCTVESAQGAVDGTVEKRWARAVANLGLDKPWQTGGSVDV